MDWAKQGRRARRRDRAIATVQDSALSLLSEQARVVWFELLRYANLAGVVGKELGLHLPLRLSERTVDVGIAELVRDGYVIRDHAGLRIPNWLEVIGKRAKAYQREGMGKRLRFEVLSRDGFKCRYCGASAPNVELVVDHVVPVVHGGATVAENLVAACQPCNAGKATRSVEVSPC